VKQFLESAMTTQRRLLTAFACAVALFSSQNVAWAARSIGLPQAQPDAMFVGDTATVVTVTASVASDATLLSTSVNLIQLNADGSAAGVVGRLYDDGTHGDAVAGDGIFSGQFVFTPTAVATEYFAATASYRGTLLRVRSPTFTVMFFQRPTDDELQSNIDVQNQGAQYFQAAQTQSSIVEARNATVAFLLLQPGVSGSGIAPDGETIWINYSTGIQGLISGSAPGTLGGSAGVRKIKPLVHSEARPLHTQFAAQMSNSVETTSSTVFPSMNNAIVLAPFFDSLSLGGSDPSDDVAADLAKVLGSGAIATGGAIKNGVVTVNLMKTLNQYGVITIYTHGNSDADGQVTIATRESDSVLNRNLHLADLLAHRIRSFSPPDGGPAVLGVNSAFVRYYSSGSFQQLPKSIVFVSACKSLGTDSVPNSSMSDAFTQHGALAYFGYRNNVWADSAASIARALYNALADPTLAADQRTTGVALTGMAGAAVDPRPQPDGTHGTLLLNGSHDVAIPMLPLLTLNPYGAQTLASAPGPYLVQVVDSQLNPKAAPADIAATIHRQVVSACRGTIFQSDITATVANGQFSATYASAGAVAGRDPFCNTLPITTTFRLTVATLLPNTRLDLSTVPAAQLSLSVTR
jgi:hypothetical protein